MIDAMALRRGGLTLTATKKAKNSLRWPRPAPWSLTLAATKKAKKLSNMSTALRRGVSR